MSRRACQAAVASVPGFEPRLAVLETVVLTIDTTPIGIWGCTMCAASAVGPSDRADGASIAWPQKSTPCALACPSQCGWNFPCLYAVAFKHAPCTIFPEKRHVWSLSRLLKQLNTRCHGSCVCWRFGFYPKHIIIKLIHAVWCMSYLFEYPPSVVTSHGHLIWLG
jgi:hypothetical protein